MSFESLSLSPPLLRAIVAAGYSVPTPIQQQAIPAALEGRDMLGCAQTGTGKTAAFALPILQRLAQSPAPGKNRDRKVRALILSPTRELAVQIGNSFREYGRHSGLRHMEIYGGVSQLPQVRALRGGVDIVVATPGRLLDLWQQRHLDLGAVEIFVLDEADRMLDMGFIHDIRKIAAKLPAKRQTLMFSATMPADIRSLADALLRDPVQVQVAAQSSTVEAIEQSVYLVDQRHKLALLEHVLTTQAIERVLVFSRTKHGADKVVRKLDKAGIRAEAIHGNKSQAARQRALEKFRSNHPPVLVATDVAARGLDIDAVSHVINFDLPNVPETYVHRIGRTGRAGASGVAISFCGGDERSDLKLIERLIRRSISVRTDHPQFAAPEANSSSANDSGRQQQKRSKSRGPRDGSQQSQPQSGSKVGYHKKRKNFRHAAKSTARGKRRKALAS